MPLEKWKATKVTIGMVGALFAALIVVWTALAAHSDRQRAERAHVISVHNADENAHSGLRETVKRLSVKVDKLNDDQRARHREIIRLLQQQARSK